ncbi:hypothetical protein HPB50_003736 [Hyalomma asiaticum]|uniref:Uncharacterized protein n=1 Tax=Hyalomma asiaticum TaxID=266040 RepID=A0ACB7TEH2_HYAAI|nr:hypothetical protein HPB50_003736 [Hyalomma asiaticum]
MEATSPTTGKFEVTQVTTPDSLAGQNSSTPLSPSIGDQDSDPSTVRLIPDARSALRPHGRPSRIACFEHSLCYKRVSGAVCDVRDDRPPDLQKWIPGPQHRSLLCFIYAGG